MCAGIASVNPALPGIVPTLSLYMRHSTSFVLRLTPLPGTIASSVTSRSARETHLLALCEWLVGMENDLQVARWFRWTEMVSCFGLPAGSMPLVVALRVRK